MHRHRLLLFALPVSMLLAAVDAYPQAASNQLSTSLSDGTAKSVAAGAAGGALEVGDKPTAQQLQERAQYWESHGRSDIAAQIRARLSYQPARNTVVPAVIAPAPAPRFRSVNIAPLAESVVAASSAPSSSSSSSQELARQAQYWEAHGRDDLASQIRQKLQQLSPAPAAAPARSLAVVPLPVSNSLNQPDATSHQALENSLQHAPDSLDSRLDLAQVYRGTGNSAKARALIDGVLANEPHHPAALFASAQLYADQRQWRSSLDTLEKVRPAARTPEMANLQKIAWAHVQLDRADTLVQLGRGAEARLLLRRIALELSIATDQTSLAEPPPLWKPEHTRPSAKRKAP